MNGMTELWHIVRKDVRQSRWLLIAYLALVIAATLGAVTRETLLDGNLQWLAAMIVVLGPIIAASIVQADSPTQPDAFWASHPFRRWAMLGAKVVLVAAVLFVVPLIGQLLGVSAFEVPAQERTAIMLTTAANYGLLLLIAVLFGALTRDLRGFILLLIGFFAMLVAIAIVRSELRWSWGDMLTDVLQTLALGGIVALFVTLYLRRGVRGARALGVGALALFLVAGVRSTDQPAPNTLANLPRATRTAGIMLQLRDTAQITRTGQAQLRLSLEDGAAARHYRLDQSHLRFFLHDGTTFDVPEYQLVTNSTRTTFSPGPLILPGGPRISSIDEPFVHSLTDVTVDLTSAQRATLMQGVDSAEFVSTVTVLEPRILMTLPLQAGAHALADGYDVRIDRLGFGLSTDVLDLSVKTVTGATGEQSWMDSENGMLAIVVNPARNEGIGLARGGASANPGLLVLPGAGLRQGTLMFRQPTGRRGQPPLVDEAFIRGASMMLVRWQPTSQYRARATSVPLPPDGFVRRERHALQASAVFR